METYFLTLTKKNCGGRLNIDLLYALKFYYIHEKYVKKKKQNPHRQSIQI